MVNVVIVTTILTKKICHCKVFFSTREGHSILVNSEIVLHFLGGICQHFEKTPVSRNSYAEYDTKSCRIRL